MAKLYTEKNKNLNEMLNPKKSTVQFLLDYSKSVSFHKSKEQVFQIFNN
jgi:hypothetical protein